MELNSSSGFTPPLVSVIVVNWNGADDLPACLDSVRAQIYEPLELLVVDNGSTDGSVNFLRRQEDLILVENRDNRGFAAANNQGIARCGGAWVLLLNTDARLAAECVEKLMRRVLEESMIGSASPKIYRADGRTLDSTGLCLHKRRFSPADRGEGQPDQGQFDAADREEIFGPTGAVALYRREALAEASLEAEVFDEDFFAYYEDVDLAWRLRLFGWESVFVPEAIAWHDRKGPSNRPGWLQRRAYANRYFCYLKNERAGALAPYILPALFYELGRSLRLVLKQPHMLGAYYHLLRRLPTMLRKRRWIQARCRVSLKDLQRFD